MVARSADVDLESSVSRPKENEPAKGLVVVVDDMDNVRRLVSKILSRDGYEVESFASGEACLSSMARLMPDAIYLDLDMPGLGGLATLERIRSKSPQVPVIMLTADDRVETVVAAMKLGAYDYIVKPAERQKILTVARNAVERHQMSVQLTSLAREAGGLGYPEIITQSDSMKAVFRQMDRVASSEIMLLVHGESGTGKELVARAIHAHSGRKQGPFVALNCAAVPETLQESELFGHEKGAFTGATESRMGTFEMADKGTLFLDEVAELSLPLQAKLLRVLQNNTFQRVGGSREIRSDFRLIAATHRNLSAAVREGRFREDLYFRIVVFELELPPLRERPGDVDLLVRHFLEEHARRHGVKVSISPEALSTLRRYSWPGNVRELSNVLQRALVFAESGLIEIQHLPERLSREPGAVSAAESPRDEGGDPEGSENGEGADRSGSEEDDVLNLEQLECRAIGKALERSPGNIAEVGRLLGISRATLYRKLKKYGLR